ncbi:ATP-binding protein [Sinanaerobacter chloroacetimidivorans]|uniref:ATP-binding protein n=1 Tax=Sinanaerobacter chloroacetimidivorans TaxID=2818044 RepID=A0A8J7W0H3_9FIRM|nr:ATP-binding protein [Sinanaerobacter chloroacetimidivorans]MBR0598517.1 ATP-binding protein [Sinanaerobacter chloroacetimidivorans]
MKQLLILSGKGGTGKTTIAGAFIKLSRVKAYADCDVDAPNLHLIIKKTADVIKTDYFGMPKAVIDPDLCRNCGVCKSNCRFDSILSSHGYTIDQNLCEGCGVCVELCPTRAISLVPYKAGELLLYQNNDGSIFSTATLKMGSGTTGKLVTEVKKKLISSAGKADLLIIDGSPGIGCPVIASLSGVDMVLIVAEPTLSGMSDMERILETAYKFKVKTAVCINKYNINIKNAESIIAYCQKNHIPYVGKIPFDKRAVEAMNSGLTIVDVQCNAGDALQPVYAKTMAQLYGN